MEAISMKQFSDGGGESSWSFQEYVLEPLRRDEEFILYRAQHRNQADKQSVLVLAPVSTRPAPESLRRMEHEYSFRAELDPAWAVRPLVLSQHSGRTMLALEDPGGAPLDGLIRGPMEVGEHDIPDRLPIREKLYGRASEIETLLTSFDFISALAEEGLLTRNLAASTMRDSKRSQWYDV